MDREVVEKVKKYAEVVRKDLPVKMVILYGSYARGSENSYSDIDVAVVVDKIEGDYLEQSAQLFHLVRDIDTRIEPVLLTGNDDRSGFLNSILKYGKIIYQ
ncbi:MAG: nucleotidyltransferase domain-containing protein [Candidatus Aminicenantes bacterium]|nr:MAG: nucleotidyltransferase domain-containing protein [Candidatus Aminicenantes bacterium]